MNRISLPRDTQQLRGDPRPAQRAQRQESPVLSCFESAAQGLVKRCLQPLLDRGRARQNSQGEEGSVRPNSIWWHDVVGTTAMQEEERKKKNEEYMKKARPLYGLQCCINEQ